MLANTDTIVALATPPGRGGVAVVRVSGPAVKEIACRLLISLPSPRHATFSRFYTPTREIIDEGIALYFPAPHSFTGDDVLELQTHGSPVVTDWLIETVCGMGARLARAGEFSERAFLNGKKDLTEVEAIADLIDAASREAAKSALRSLQGDFSEAIHRLLDLLTTLRMLVEAAIDFSEEEIDFAADNELVVRTKDLINQLEALTARAEEGSRLREGLTVVITGKPNAGKSSLLNCLSGRSAAIVTAIPGTTRDVLREQIVLQGMPVQLVDTAGIRQDSDDPIEQEGIRRARKALETADLVLCIRDASEETTVSSDLFPCERKLDIRNKIDLTGEPAGRWEDPQSQTVTVSLSAHTGLGIDLLVEEIRHFSSQTSREGIFSARRRHLEALARARTYLDHALEQLKKPSRLDCAAEELRLAQKALAEITGEFTPDDLLSKIFSSFCIGK